MKALILGLLGVTVLAGCATTPDMKVATTDKLGEIPAAGVGFCNANDGVYVVLLGTDGKTKEFACPSKGNKKITQPDKIPNLPNSKEIKLGTTYKFFDSTDPCYVWVFGGSRYHVCWEEII